MLKHRFFVAIMGHVWVGGPQIVFFLLLLFTSNALQFPSFGNNSLRGQLLGFAGQQMLEQGHFELIQLFLLGFTCDII